MTQPIDLYFWPTPNGWKASIVLEELAMPYQLHLVNIGAGDQFKPDFLEISPNNRTPAIIDYDGPDGAPISIFESGESFNIWHARPVSYMAAPPVTKSTWTNGSCGKWAG